MKKVYKKPQIEKIKLVLEEAVLQACKISHGMASVGPTDYWCGWKGGIPAAPCREEAS